MQINAGQKNFSLRKFGIEIEAYGANQSELVEVLREKGIVCRRESYNHTTQAHWKIVGDASIRGERSFEIVSPILEGAEGLVQVRKICEALGQVGARVNRSCGLHVHHDASDFTAQTLKKFIKLYRKCEPILDMMMPRSRRGNNNTYCRSMYNGLSDAQLVGSRYQKINLTSYQRHGTIEFRHHSGTTEFKKIKNWVLLTAFLVEKAKGRIGTDKRLDKWIGLRWYLGIAPMINKDRVQVVDDIVIELNDYIEGRIRELNGGRMVRAA